ncbi:MAG: hypothetical protein R3F59_23765 [Myxococcota bacterium]
MIRNLEDLARAAALGAVVLATACSGDDGDKTTGDTAPMSGCPTSGCPTSGCPNTGCPTTGCPTTGCPTTGCPTSGCPTAAEGPGAFAPDYATSGEFFTLMAGPVDAGSVHGTVQIWYSTNVRTQVEAGTPFTAPVGTVAIKEQTNGAGDAIVVMIKQEAGYDAAHNDWLYEQRDAGGTLGNSGPLQGCWSCHQGWPDTDYLAGTDLR